MGLNLCTSFEMSFAHLSHRFKVSFCDHLSSPESSVISNYFKGHPLLKLMADFFSSTEPKAQGELIVWDSSRCPSVHPLVRPSVCASTLSNMNISETSWPIVNKFHRKHHWGGGLAALGFWPDPIRNLVSMATDSSHRIIMGRKPCDHFSSFIFDWFFFFLAGYENNHKILDGFEIWHYARRIYELAALEGLKKSQ